MQAARSRRVHGASLSMVSTWTLRTGDASISAVACCHPAFFGKEAEYSEAAQVPVCMLPAEGDVVDDAKAVLDAKPFADKCVLQRFDDQVHGFLAARGDYSKPEVAAAAGKGIQILCSFFTSCMVA